MFSPKSRGKWQWRHLIRGAIENSKARRGPSLLLELLISDNWLLFYERKSIQCCISISIFSLTVPGTHAIPGSFTGYYVKKPNGLPEMIIQDHNLPLPKKFRFQIRVLSLP